MRLLFIRHGATAGNLEKRYVGTTDEPLCPAGRAALLARDWPAAACVITSPMRRCLETAALIYPAQAPQVVDAFRECDFGAFEYKNYQALNGRADYQAWIDSGGTLPFPGGESRDAFARRCADAFQKVMRETRAESAALVLHGGAIMAILERYAVPKRGYFDYRLPNAAAYTAVWDGEWVQEVVAVRLSMKTD